MLFKKKPFIRYIYFEEYNDWIPYDANKQPLYKAVEEACNRKVYNQLNPGGVPYDTKYKMVFDHRDGDFVNIIIYNKRQSWMI